MPTASALLIQRLGNAGLAPFVLLAATVWLVDADLQPWAAMAMAAYAALIVSYLGGIHWGLAWKQPDAPADQQRAHLIWGVAPAFADEAFAQGASEDAQSIASSLNVPYCGNNPGLEAAQWLVDPASAASLALIPLRVGAAPDAFGLLVLASADPQRFAADMGTDFLERIGELASAALARLRPVVPATVE